MPEYAGTSDDAVRETQGGVPHLSAGREGAQLRLIASGDWTLKSFTAMQEAVSSATQQTGQYAREAVIDLAQLGRLDTAGALTLVKLLRAPFPQATASFVNVRRDHKILLDEVTQGTKTAPPPAPKRKIIAETVSVATLALTAIMRDAVRLTGFLGEVSIASARAAARPWRFRWTSLFYHLQQTGLNAVPIIALVCFLIGGVIMQQGAQQLRAFGAETMAIDMLGVLALREVGILLTAVMVAGRSASAFTAQIGTMKMREEVDAMRTLGIDPIETLVVPRILALVIALPLLVFIADIMCLAGGAVMAKLYLGLDLPIYIDRLHGALDARHFFVGIVKAPFAALIIGLVGCLEGLSVQGSAESVGTQVTAAVVKAIFLVLILDGVFAIFLSASGY